MTSRDNSPTPAAPFSDPFQEKTGLLASIWETCSILHDQLREESLAWSCALSRMAQWTVLAQRTNPHLPLGGAALLEKLRKARETHEALMLALRNADFRDRQARDGGGYPEPGTEAAPDPGSKRPATEPCAEEPAAKRACFVPNTVTRLALRSFFGELKHFLPTSDKWRNRVSNWWVAYQLGLVADPGCGPGDARLRQLAHANDEANNTLVEALQGVDFIATGRIGSDSGSDSETD